MSALASFALLLFVGGAAAVTDWRERRVPNRLVLLALSAVAAWTAVQFASSVLGHLGRRWLGLGAYYLPWRWYPRVAAHVLLSLTAGWTLWRLDVWPAGDAKLYLALSALLPFVDPNLPGFPSLLFMVLLINIFVPAGLLFAAEGTAGMMREAPAALARGPWPAVKGAGDRIRVRLKELYARRAQAALVAFNLAALFFVLRVLEQKLRARVFGGLGHVAIFLLLYAAWGRAAPILRRPSAGAAALAAAAIGAVVASTSGGDLLVLLRRAAGGVVSFGFFLSIARMAFDRQLESAGLGRLPADDVRAGTIPTDEAWTALNGDPRLARLLDERRRDGLSADEASAVKNWLRSSGTADLPVHRAVPFAAWILIGAVLTVWRPGTVVSWLAPYAERAWRSAAAAGGWGP
jgi:Flp pilus assembly protein protease CpaA